MRRYLRTICGLILLTLLLLARSGGAFTALYVFGDSLSDTGRSPATPSTNYFNGRFSNGPLWVEYLSADLGIPYNPSNNFAVSGTTTADLLAQIAGVPASTNLDSARRRCTASPWFPMTFWTTPIWPTRVSTGRGQTTFSGIESIPRPRGTP